MQAPKGHTENQRKQDCADDEALDQAPSSRSEVHASAWAGISALKQVAPADWHVPMFGFAVDILHPYRNQISYIIARRQKSFVPSDSSWFATGDLFLSAGFRDILRTR